MKSILKYFFSTIGYKISRKPNVEIITENNEKPTRFRVGEFEYDLVTPSVKYSPWLQDLQFMKMYAQISDHTLVDMYRCFELWDITQIIHQLNKSVNFIEVGVWKGGTAAIIGKKLALLNSNANFYICDTFSGVVKASEKDITYKGGEHADTSLEIVENLLSDNYTNIKILKGVFPNETAQQIPVNDLFGFCHIDVDVYDSAKDIVDWIWDKLIIGGVVIFDDYGYSTCTGITRFVNEQKNSRDRIITYNYNGHAVMIKIH